MNFTTQHLDTASDIEFDARNAMGEAESAVVKAARSGKFTEITIAESNFSNAARAYAKALTRRATIWNALKNA
jgi:hypothetical protein